jgi:hypothetical protein
MSLIKCACMAALVCLVRAADPSCAHISALPQYMHPGVPQAAAEQKCKGDCAQPGYNCEAVQSLYPTLCTCGSTPVVTPTPAPPGGSPTDAPTMPPSVHASGMCNGLDASGQPTAAAQGAKCRACSSDGACEGGKCVYVTVKGCAAPTPVPPPAPTVKPSFLVAGQCNGVDKFGNPTPASTAAKCRVCTSDEMCEGGLCWAAVAGCGIPPRFPTHAPTPTPAPTPSAPTMPPSVHAMCNGLDASGQPTAAAQGAKCRACSSDGVCEGGRCMKEVAGCSTSQQTKSISPVVLAVTSCESTCKETCCRNGGGDACISACGCTGKCTSPGLRGGIAAQLLVLAR